LRNEIDARSRRALSRLAVTVVLAPVRAYRLLLSPLLGNHCRFYPSCSTYCIEAVERHGPLRGLWFTLKRLGKCHPLHPGGVDRVPDAALTRKRMYE